MPALTPAAPAPAVSEGRRGRRTLRDTAGVPLIRMAWRVTIHKHFMLSSRWMRQVGRNKLESLVFSAAESKRGCENMVRSTIFAYSTLVSSGFEWFRVRSARALVHRDSKIHPSHLPCVDVRISSIGGLGCGAGQLAAVAPARRCCLCFWPHHFTDTTNNIVMSCSHAC